MMRILMPKKVHPEPQEMARTLKLAFLDWMLVPTQTILQELDCQRSTLTKLRLTEEYKTEFAELEESWKKQIFKRPETNEIFRTISLGIGIGVRKLVHVIAQSKVDNRTLIAAVNTLSKMDPRFARGDKDNAQSAIDPENSVASELVQLLQRTKQQIQ